MKRREFIFSGGAALIALTLPGRNNYAFAADNKTTGACVPTTADILGPFYRTGAPFRSDLTVSGNPGALFRYKGTVLDENCSAIAGAIVDVWQADDGGAYDNTTANFNYRGRYQTGSAGMYEFTAVKPGWYLNGSQYRPSHIHFRVTKPGYKEIITQLYFKDDPYIAADPWASDPDAEKRIVPIAQVGGVDTVVFDITLEGPPVGITEMEHASPVAIVPNPFSGEINLTSAATNTMWRILHSV
ncbi:MAG: catechol 1,2-dioxygenase [Flavipsychrobacter sp.]|nr:catechol 1,2-dioxygenase [Flavipsychrobacter sp.]